MQQEFITVQNIRLSYSDNQLKKAQTILFIHGFPFNKEQWQPQVAHFQDKYRCIAIDVRGHGESEAGNEPFSIDLFADDILALMQQLKIDKPVICGLSMGGYIALNAITRFPIKFSGLILCDTNCFADSPESVQKRMHTIDNLPKIGRSVYATESLKNLFSKDSLTTQPDVVYNIQKMIENTSEESMIKTLNALATRSETCSKLSLIDVPVLIMVGEYDIITPFSAAEAMWEKIPQSELFVVERAGHLPNLENTVDFNNLLGEFLAQY